MSHKYEVHTQTKGILTFDELPKNTYFGQGYPNPSDKNKAFWFGWETNNILCLIPIIDTKGNFIYKKD